MATFPGYPTLMAAGFAQKRSTALLRTQMESGPPKQLKVKSRVMVTRPVSYFLSTLSDFNNFVTFFQTTINYGADWFTWTDPLDSVAKLARIVGELDVEEPGVAMTYWVVKFNLETWTA